MKLMLLVGKIYLERDGILLTMALVYIRNHWALTKIDSLKALCRTVNQRSKRGYLPLNKVRISK